MFWRLIVAVGFLALPASATLAPAAAAQDVVTYHNDTYRTGWFSTETTLTPSNVNASSFGLLHTVTLDARVDAEPLVVFNQSIAGQGTHDVLYAATENNSVYAIDAESGAILWSINFGPSVPYQYKNGDDNIYPIMGILGTPVIDRSLNSLFVVADTLNGSVDVFTLHAIALNNGSDNVTPMPIEVSEPLQGGKSWVFDPQYHLQHPGLLEANGNIYVSFGSNGDSDPNYSRGLILAYNATTLAPVNGKLTDAKDEHRRNPAPYYLSSLWQSGYAPALDENGNIFVSTGNSDYVKPSYNAIYNHPDSVLEISGNLSTLLGSFTPSDYFSLDQGDVDLGSGGTMVIPEQSGPVPRMVVGGGKDGRVFLLNRDDLGGFSKKKNRVLDTESMGGCWCGPAYYVGSDGIPRVVTGGGNGVTSWQLQLSPPRLAYESSNGSANTDGLPDDGGTMPVVSSNGTTAGTAVVWYVQRPQTSNDNNPGTPVTLWAYAASNLGGNALFSAHAGTWTHAVNSNANITPTVANGRVYVASNMQLQIFGLLGGRKK